MKRMECDDCFVCGYKNPIGLHLDIEDGEGCAKAVWTIRPEFVGYANIFHGGIMASIMDDLMCHSICFMDVDVMTVHMEMDYKAPAYVGEEIVCEAHIEEYNGRRSIRTAGTIRRGDTLIAEAKGIMVIVKDEHKKEM